MAGTTNRPYSSTYKDNLRIENSNVGADATARAIYDSVGTETSTKISTNVLNVRPKASNSTTTFSVTNKNGNPKFSVDTSGNQVLSLGVNNNTQFKSFGVFAISPTSDTHYAMPIAGSVGNKDRGSANWSPEGFGTDDDPESTHATAADEAINLTPCIWWLDYPITIDSIRVVASAADDSTLDFYVAKYTMGTGTGVAAGDLTTRATLASLTLTNVNDDRIRTGTLTIASSDVSSNSVVLAFVKNTAATHDVTATMEIRYHITGT